MLLLINILCYNAFMDNRIKNKLKIIGHNIYQARQMQGMTMQDVAEKTGLCRQTVSEAEQGNEKLQIGTYMMIMEAVGVDANANILPQLFPRAIRQVDDIDKCRGIASDGTEFIIRTRKDGKHILFDFDGKSHDMKMQDNSFAEIRTMQDKEFYLFSAGCEVVREKNRLQLAQKAKELESGRNLHFKAQRL